MSQLLLCNSPVTSSSIESIFGFTSDAITGVNCVNPNTLNAYQPYLATDTKPTASDFAILNQFNSASNAKEITNLSL